MKVHHLNCGTIWPVGAPDGLICHVLLVNKIDVLPYFDFDMAALTERAKKLNPDIEIIPICARTGEGIDVWADWLRRQVADWKK